MPFLYHIVHPVMIGTTILPLSTLKETHPKLYEYHSKKYKGREQVMNYFLPPLQCNWTEVIFLSPVHPHKIAEARKVAGSKLHKEKFFEIDSKKLDPSKTTIWTYRTGEKNPDDFEPFTDENLSKYTTVPKKTIDYYTHQERLGLPILIYAFIPHILFKGTVDVSDAKIIES